MVQHTSWMSIKRQQKNSHIWNGAKHLETVILSQSTQDTRDNRASSKINETYYIVNKKNKELIQLLLTSSQRRYLLIDFIKSICPEQKKDKLAQKIMLNPKHGYLVTKTNHPELNQILSSMRFRLVIPIKKYEKTKRSYKFNLIFVEKNLL